MRSTRGELRREARRADRAGHATGFTTALVAGVAGMALVGSHALREEPETQVAAVTNPASVRAAAAVVPFTSALHTVGLSAGLSSREPDVQTLVNSYCVACHNKVSAVAG